MTLRTVLLPLLLAASSWAQAQSSGTSNVPPPAADAAGQAQLREKVVQQARTAGQLAAVMLKCTIRPNALQAQSLVDYRLTVVSLGAEAGLSESEVDDLADAARDSTMDRLPATPAPELCEAARMRIAAIAQAYGLFQMRPPAAAGSPEPAEATEPPGSNPPASN